jgi:hypothetical protein
MFRASQCPSSGVGQTAVAASGFHMNVQVDVFSAVVGLLVTNKPTTAENSQLEIRINVTMYQLCVSEEVTWNVTEY